MQAKCFNIEHIPAILWGDSSRNVFISVHGKHSRKEESEQFAKKAALKGYQILSFDLPEHGDRTQEAYPCVPANIVRDLNIVANYVRQNWSQFSLYAVSMGAYFSLLAYRDLPMKQSLFLSPILDMKRLIQNMMQWSGVTEEQLEREKIIPTQIGETLDWDYFSYVVKHPIAQWNSPTDILYGSEDNLTERAVLDSFAEHFSCGVTVLEGGAHWFHTEPQLACLEQWLEEHIVPNL